MDDSGDEDYIEEVCDYLDGKIAQYCDSEHVSPADRSTFYQFNYDYKKELRKGKLKPPFHPKDAFKTMLEQFHEYVTVKEQLNEGVGDWKNRDPEWEAHVKEVVHETKQLFLEAFRKHPDEISSFSNYYKVISKRLQEYIVRLKKQETTLRKKTVLFEK